MCYSLLSSVRFRSASVLSAQFILESIHSSRASGTKNNELTFSNSLIIHTVTSQSECPILVSWMYLDTQWKSRSRLLRLVQKLMKTLIKTLEFLLATSITMSSLLKLDSRWETVPKCCPFGGIASELRQSEFWKFSLGTRFGANWSFLLIYRWLNFWIPWQTITVKNKRNCFLKERRTRNRSDPDSTSITRRNVNLLKNPPAWPHIKYSFHLPRIRNKQ